MEMEARQIRLYLSKVTAFVEYIWTMHAFPLALRCGFIPGSAREQAMEKKEMNGLGIDQPIPDKGGN